MYRMASEQPSEGIPSSGDADRFVIHVRALIAIRDYLIERGHDQSQIRKVLAQYGLESADVQAFHGFISIQRFALLLRGLSVVSGDPTLGLKLGDRTDASSLGVLGQAFQTAPNLENALELLATHMRLYADVSFSGLSVSDSRVEFTWSYSPLIRMRDELTDRAARLFVRSIRTRFSPDWWPVEVHLQRRTPADVTPYRQFLAPVVHFDTPANMVVLRASDLSRPNLNADAFAHEAAMELVRRVSAERRVPDDLRIRVSEDIVAHMADSGNSVSETARRMGMSTRVLQRKLDALGTSYHDLCDRLRKDSAIELLRGSDLPLAEVAFRLGFSNQANLSRAVKRWLGQSPSSVRTRSDDG